MRYFEPVCISVDAEADYDEIALVVYDPMKVHVSAKSDVGSHPDWTKKEFGQNIKVRFCSLWDRRKGDFARHPCELQRRGSFMAQTCWFRTADENNRVKNNYNNDYKTDGAGNFFPANFIALFAFFAGFIVML